MLHFYDYIIMTVFSLLVLLSLNEIVMNHFEKDLGSRMIIEHMIFFSIRALSICVAECSFLKLLTLRLMFLFAIPSP